MVKDVDETELVSSKLAYDYMGDAMHPRDLSSGVKCLILMYKVDCVLINGNKMGNNCAKWLIEIGKLRDCYMTLAYYMAFNRYLKSKDSEFVVEVINRKIITRTFSEYKKLFTNVYSSGEYFEFWQNPSIDFDVIMKFDWKPLYESIGGK
jgi:hypothetical protein